VKILLHHRVVVAPEIALSRFAPGGDFADRDSRRLCGSFSAV